MLPKSSVFKANPSRTLFEIVQKVVCEQDVNKARHLLLVQFLDDVASHSLSASHQNAPSLLLSAIQSVYSSSPDLKNKIINQFHIEKEEYLSRFYLKKPKYTPDTKDWHFPFRFLQKSSVHSKKPIKKIVIGM